MKPSNKIYQNWRRELVRRQGLAALRATLAESKEETAARLAGKKPPNEEIKKHIEGLRALFS